MAPPVRIKPPTTRQPPAFGSQASLWQLDRLHPSQRLGQEAPEGVRLVDHPKGLPAQLAGQPTGVRGHGGVASAGEPAADGLVLVPPRIPTVRGGELELLQRRCSHLTCMAGRAGPVQGWPVRALQPAGPSLEPAAAAGDADVARFTPRLGKSFPNTACRNASAFLLFHKI